jgi:hypothetical protein
MCGNRSWHTYAMHPALPFGNDCDNRGHRGPFEGPSFALASATDAISNATKNPKSSSDDSPSILAKELKHPSLSDDHELNLERLPLFIGRV